MADALALAMLAAVSSSTAQMIESARHRRNRELLQQLHPRFAARVAALIEELESEGWRPRIAEAWRSPAAQLAAWEAGHTRLRRGLHNLSGPDGRPEALAVDLLDDDAPSVPGRAFLLRLAAAAEAAGLRSGIRWGLPRPLARAIDTAIANREWNAPVKLGWDPAHVEAADIPVAEARAGRRPA
jgi:hypothetical protein